MDASFAAEVVSYLEHTRDRGFRRLLYLSAVEPAAEDARTRRQLLGACRTRRRGLDFYMEAMAQNLVTLSDARELCFRRRSLLCVRTLQISHDTFPRLVRRSGYHRGTSAVQTASL